jgi:PAS domain S-box-containing protein
MPSAAVFSLARLRLRAEQDLVSLTRRTRAAGEDFGLHARDVGSLSAATYEAARILYGHGIVEAEVRLSEGPSLQVVFRTLVEGAEERERLSRVLADALIPLHAMVDDVQIEERDTQLSVCLRILFPTGVIGRPDASVSMTSSLKAPPADVPPNELRQRYQELEHASEELRAELQETNRGVVALHAELEANAEQLRQAEDRLRLLLDSVQDYAICMLTPHGEVASWNSGAERLFGYAADEIIGRHVGWFYPAVERDLDVPSEQLRLAEERGRFACECLRVRHGGAAFDAHVVVTAVRRGRERELRGFSLVVRDITERKRLEDDLRRRAEDLAAANRAKEDFLATLSHELRTPLNAMLGWTRLLRMGKLEGAAMARALETIERNAHIQEQLIADILDISRIVTGKLRVELRTMPLSPVVDAALDAVRPAAEAKGIGLAASSAYAGTVLGDPDRLQQVIWNLLVNAVKFTPPGGRVTIDVGRRGASAEITVTDTGEGISRDLLPIVFDRFTQGDGSVTRPHGGLGLGLSIVRHIVELHGGKVHAHSEGRGRGSMFVVSLPIPAVQHAVVPKHTFTGQPLNGLKVLVVDDDPDAREVVSTALAQCGARTTAVGSAGEALKMMGKFRPDVLVSDISMPGEDGYAFIRRLRAAGDFSDIPAVALTGFSEPEARHLALTAGFQRFVPKPVEVDELAEVVLTLAERGA